MIEIRAVKLRFRPQKQKLEEIERRKKRQSQRGIAFLFDKNHFAEFARIRAETFGALQVGEDFHEYPIRYNARMAAHFYKDVEKVVFLIAFFIVALDFGEFGSILAFLVYFRCKKRSYYAITIGMAVLIWAAFRFGLNVKF